MFTHIPPRLIWDIWMGAMMCRFLMWLATLVTSGFIRGGLVAQLTEKSRNVTAATFKWRLTSPQISNRDVWCLVSIKFGRYWHRGAGNHQQWIAVLRYLLTVTYLCLESSVIFDLHSITCTIVPFELRLWCIGGSFVFAMGTKRFITKRTSCMILLCQSANEKVIDTRQSHNTI